MKWKFGKSKENAGHTLTYTLISICVLVYIGELIYASIYGPEAINALFRDYGYSLSGFLNGNFWTPVTSIFLHAGPAHLIMNMIALFFFGRVIEDHIGRKKFLLVFFFSSFIGTVAVSASVLLGWMPAGVPTVGASAAIFGLLGAAMMIAPFEMVFYPYIIPVPLILVALIYTLYNIGAFITVLLTGGEAEIAYAAHLGGLFAGTFFGFREEGTKHGILILVLIFFILLLIPFLMSALAYLEIFNYMALFTSLFG